MNIDETLKQAVEHHQAGQLQDAERLYCAVLQADPRHPDANNNLGVLLTQTERTIESLPYFEAALGANPNQGLYWQSYIRALIQADLPEMARQALELGRHQGVQGDEIDELALLSGQWAEAATPPNAESKNPPPNPNAVDLTRPHPNPPPLGEGASRLNSTALPPLGEGTVTLNSTALLPNPPPLAEGTLELKSTALPPKPKPSKPGKPGKKSSKHKGDNPSPRQINALGALLNEGRYPEAATLAQTMTVRFPQNGSAWKLLGVALKQMGRNADALKPMQKAAALLPDDAGAQRNLGATLYELGRLSEAEACYHQALKIKPDDAGAHINLGIALIFMGRLGEAEASYRRALEINPGYAAAHSNLGSILGNMGRLDEAESSQRRALQLKPDYEDAFGNLLFGLNYAPDKSGEDIFAAYREYDAQFGLPYRSEWRPHGNSRDTRRRLKIGYVSGDFYKHPVRHILEPLLENHDKDAFEVHAYAELAKEDEVTARFKQLVDHWIPTCGLSDNALAERIRADGIDILVDLAGHTAGNRLGVFARKPAPVSVSWLGYAYTTGLTAIDYYLTDETMVPAGSEGLFSEKPWRLATTNIFWRPPDGMGEINPLPTLSVGHVTFGSLSRGIRLNHHVIRVWSALLNRVKDARLVIDSRDFRDAYTQESLAEKFAAHGISRDRLQIGYHSPPWDTLRGIDIGLDCFPHNSGATLIESLYMGVPYITLAGRPSVGRVGSMLLHGAGHPEWIAESEDGYVAKAVELAGDLARLSEIRATLRNQIDNGPFRDEIGFVRKLEEAYREMWSIWCETGDKA
ncbi:MAG: tetratricopeptide repeat protein [Proteobacteria bacterium]|nr:tetratricopeptide repeat protein [Pseudomonadota bacterium]